MSKINNSIRFLVSCILMCLIAFSQVLNAQSKSNTQVKSQIALCVTSIQPTVSVLFELTIIKDGKKIKTQILKTPFKRMYSTGNVIFILKRIRGKSNILYNVTNIDYLNRETGSSSSTEPKVRFIINGENISVSGL